MPKRLPGTEANGSGGVALVLADPYSFPAEVLLRELERSRPEVPALGGLASASVAGGSVLLQDGEVHSEGAVAPSSPTSRCCPASRRGRCRSARR